MQPRVEEDLVRVDVADTGDYLLVKDQGLYLGPPAPERLAQIFYAANPSSRGSGPRGESRASSSSSSSTRALVNPSGPVEEPPASVEMEDEHERRPRLLHRRDEQELAPRS